MVWKHRQSRQPLFWANRQYLRLRARPQFLGREWNQLLMGAESQERRVRRSRGAVPAAFSCAGGYLRSLRLPATAVPSRKSPVQGRLALAERGCRLRIHHSATLGGWKLPNAQRRNGVHFSWRRRSMRCRRAPSGAPVLSAQLQLSRGL